ncbi:sensory histidine kinase DcuS [compost metagenome]
MWLSIALQETALSFEIRDDGVGMSDEKLAEIWGEERANHGIGISNIHRRLLKYYGAGLQISSMKGQGTTVVFTIPLEGSYSNEGLSESCQKPTLY